MIDESRCEIKLTNLTYRFERLLAFSVTHLPSHPILLYPLDVEIRESLEP